MTDASSAQLPVTANFINPPTMHHPAGYTHVVQVTYYLVDATQLPLVREVRDQFVNIRQPPASTAVEVRRLVRDDLLIEVEAAAVVASFQPMTATA
jgi:enamine deaminase RidA (YjgF/YER057c/UK114 family)